MAEDRIDSIIDRAAVMAEVEATKAEVQQLIALIQSTKAANVNVMNAKTFTEYNAGVKVLNVEQYKLIKSTELLSKANSDAAKNAAINEKQVKILEKSIKENKKVADDAANSYKQLSLAYNDAALRAKNYSLTLGAQHPVTIATTKDANALGAKLKELDASTGTFNRNVGNYSKSITEALKNQGNSIVNFGKSAFGFIRTASNIIPGLGLSGAFLLIGTGIAALVKAISGADKEISSFIKNQRIVGEIGREAAKGLGEESAKLELIRLKLNDVNIPASERIKLAKSYNETAEKANQLDLTQIDNLELINSNIYDQIELIKKRAIARAAEAIIGQKAEKLQLAIEDERTESLKKATIYIENLKKSLESRARLGLPVATQVNIDLEAAAKAISQAAPKVVKAREELERALTIGAGLINVDDLFKPDKKETKEKKSRDLAEADRKADFEREKNRLTTIADINNKIAADNERHIAERSQAAFRAFIAETDLIQLAADFEKKTKGLTKKEIQVIDEKANQDLLKAELKYYDSLLKAKKDFDKEYFDEDEKLRTQLEKGIADYFKKFQKDLDEQQAARQRNQDKALKDAEDLAKKKFDLEKQLSTELQNLVFSILDGNITKRKNALQAELDDIERNKAREIELAGNNVNLIAGIEARAAVARETIARKQRELDVKKAQFDKLQAIAGIIQNTAVAITNALKTPVLIPLIIAIGAAQLATVLATPIPRYKGGGEHEGGLMIVGDGGRAEGIELPDGTVLKSPATSTLMDAPAGTVIHKDFNKMMFTATMTKPVEYAAKAVTDSSAKVVSGLKAVERAIGKIPQTHIEVSNPLKQRIRYGHSINEHITRNLGK